MAARKTGDAGGTDQPDTGTKPYRTKEKSSILFDIQIHGEQIYGQWCADPGIVEFQVPSEAVEGFEKHWHFVSGNVVEFTPKA
jgi:hypothetical protein